MRGKSIEWGPARIFKASEEKLRKLDVLFEHFLGIHDRYGHTNWY